MRLETRAAASRVGSFNGRRSRKKARPRPAATGRMIYVAQIEHHRLRHLPSQAGSKARNYPFLAPERTAERGARTFVAQLSWQIRNGKPKLLLVCLQSRSRY